MKIKKTLVTTLLLSLFIVAGCQNNNDNSTNSVPLSNPALSTTIISSTGNSTASSSTSLADTSSISDSSTQSSSNSSTTTSSSSPTISSSTPINSSTSTSTPVEQPSIYLFGPAVKSWTESVKVEFLEENIFGAYLQFSNSAEGFVISELNTLDDLNQTIFHSTTGGNITVLHNGEYLFKFTYLDMSSDNEWLAATFDINGLEGSAYYQLLPQFEIPTAPNAYYIFGPGATGANWSNSLEMLETEKDSGIYFISNHFSNIGEASSGFVVYGGPARGDTSVFCLHKNGGGNFGVTAPGIYELFVTSNDMSSDSSWSLAVETNGTGEVFYYKFTLITPDEPIIEGPTADALWVYGPAICDASNEWNLGYMVNKVNDTLYQAYLRIGTTANGFVIYESKNKSDGFQIKTAAGTNISVASAGIYLLSVTWDDMSENVDWVKATVSNTTDDHQIYYNILPIADYTRTNLTLGTGVTATASSANKSPSNVLTVESSDSSRWETAHSDPHWIQLDFAKDVSFDEIFISWYGGAAAKNYTIEYSSDGIAYTKIDDYVNTDATRQRIDTICLDEPITARYLKITGTARVGTYGYSIAHIGVFEAIV